MYSIYLEQIIQFLNRSQKLSFLVYKYNRRLNQFSLKLEWKRIRNHLWLLRIYIAQLFICTYFGLRECSIVNAVLCFIFIASRLALYSIFLIISEPDVLRDAVNLMNRMLKYEKQTFDKAKFGKILEEILKSQSIFALNSN